MTTTKPKTELMLSENEGYEKVSGASNSRKELNQMLSECRSGDTVCVVRLDRLGRRMMKLAEMIADFKDKGIHFESLENKIDTSTPMGMLMFNICAAFSEMERELIKERVQASIDAAKLKGRVGGRPKALTPEKVKQLQRLKKSGEFSEAQICHLLGVSRSVYYRATTRKGDTYTNNAIQ